MGAGATAKLSQSVSLSGGIDYGNNLDSRQQEQFGGNIGVRISG